MTSILFVASVLLSALFSGLETGLYTTSRLRLFLDDHAGLRAARQARRLLADMPTLLSVLLVANNLANYAASYVAQVLLVEWSVGSPELVGTVGVSAVLFLLAESVPKSAFRRHRERLLYPALPFLQVAYRLLRWPTWPLTWFARRLSTAVRRRVGVEVTVPGEREAMLATGAAEGFLTAFQERVARGVLAMRSRRVDEEVLPLQRFPHARLGSDEVVLPAGRRDHRALVLDAEGRSVVGWLPLARLRRMEGWRAPRLEELRRVPQVDGALGLDRLYVILDGSGAPFAVVSDAEGVRGVVDATGLRQRVMGTFSDVPEAAEAG